MRKVPIEKVAAFLESGQGGGVDEELSELAGLVSEMKASGVVETERIYQQIKQNILKDIRFREMAATVIIRDLQEIRKSHPRHHEIIEKFILSNDISYAQMAEGFGISKQRVFAIVSNEAARFQWLKNLMEIKAAEDCRNENNRSVFFKVKRRNKTNFRGHSTDGIA